MSDARCDVVAVLEAIGSGCNRFRATADDLRVRLERVQVSQPTWKLQFSSGSPAHAFWLDVDVHLPGGSLDWSVGVDWQSDAAFIVTADQSWDFWYPYDGRWMMREAEWLPTDIDGLRAALLVAIDDVTRWVAATDFAVIGDPVGIWPSDDGYREAQIEICRRLGISGSGACP